MLGHNGLFLALIHFFHLALAVPNPANEVFSRDPAATVGPFPTINKIANLTTPANTTELAITSTAVSSLAESTTTNNVAPQGVRSINCGKNSNKSPLLLDVFDAWDSLKFEDDTCSSHFAGVSCNPIVQKGKAKILACPDKNNPPSWTCKGIADLVEQYARNCGEIFGLDLKVGGKIPYSGNSYVEIVSAS